MSFSAPLRSIVNSSGLCTKCRHLRCRTSGNGKTKREGLRFSSGIARTKPLSAENLGKSLWKKKKKKNSDINEKVHAELCSVLNRRAVQLVFNRESNQLHRTLVTNFSFMDFPLQESAEAFTASMTNPSLQKMFERVTLDKDSALSIQVNSMSWQSQVSSFEKRLDEVLNCGTERSHSIVIDDSHLFRTGEQVAASGNDLSLSSPALDTIWPQVSDNDILSRLAPIIQTQEDPEGKTLKTINTPKSIQTVSLVVKKNKEEALVNKSKTTVIQKKEVAQKQDTALSVGSADMDNVIEPEVNVDVHDLLTEGPVLALQNTLLSKLDMRKLKKIKSEQDKFHLDPAKFNHNFNQELLAFVDACCFVGLENLALHMIKVCQLYMKTPDIAVPGMQQIKDINIFNKLLHAFAKRCQLGQIKDLLSILQETGLKANMQTYAAVWECLGRLNVMDLEEGHKLLRQMEAEGLDVRDLFCKSVFCKDEQEFISKAILAVDPYYKANPPERPCPPAGPLVDGLNKPLDRVVEENPYAGVLSSEAAMMLMETQMQRELRNTITVKSILKQLPASHRTLQYRKKLDSVKEEWKGLLMKAFERKLRFMARKNKMEFGMSVYPYLKLLEPQEYVKCLIQEIEDLAMSSESFSLSKNALWRRVGERIYTKFVVSKKIRNHVPKKVGLLYSQYLKQYLDKNLSLTSHRQIWQELMQQHPQGPSLDAPVKVWPSHIYLALGKLLYEIIIYDLKIDTNLFKTSAAKRNLVPAFYTIYRHYSNQVCEEIKLHPVLVKLYKGAELEELTFDAGHLPMLVPPLPWISTTHGGYLFTSVGLVRLPAQGQTQTDKLQETAASSRLATVLDSINLLSACAWVINKPILDIIIDMFHNNGNPGLDIPPPASQCPTPPKITQGMTAQQKAQIHWQNFKLKNQKAEMYSLWCQELYKLSIANKVQ